MAIMRRASSSVVLSSGITSVSTRFRSLPASFSVPSSEASALVTSAPISSSGSLSSLARMPLSFASRSGMVLATTGSTGTGCAPVDLRLGRVREVVEGHEELAR